MKLNAQTIAREHSPAEWSTDELAETEAAKVFALAEEQALIDPDIAPMISSVLDSSAEWLDIHNPDPDTQPPEPEIHLRLLKNSLKNLQHVRLKLDAPEQERVDKLIDEIARFVREKDALVKRKAIRS